MYGLHEIGMLLTNISSYQNIPLTTVHSIVARRDQEGKEEEGREWHLKTSKAQDKVMVEEALKNCHNSYQDIAKKIASDVSEKTIKHKLLGKKLKNWMA